MTSSVFMWTLRLFVGTVPGGSDAEALNIFSVSAIGFVSTPKIRRPAMILVILKSSPREDSGEWGNVNFVGL